MHPVKVRLSVATSHKCSPAAVVLRFAEVPVRLLGDTGDFAGFAVGSAGDVDGDGKADKQIVWADNLHLPMGFEFAPEGVYLSQGTCTKDLLAKWSMDECRSIGSLEDPGDSAEEDCEPSGEDVHTAQRLAGGPN